MKSTQALNSITGSVCCQTVQDVFGRSSSEKWGAQRGSGEEAVTGGWRGRQTHGEHRQLYQKQCFAVTCHHGNKKQNVKIHSTLKNRKERIKSIQ